MSENFLRSIWAPKTLKTTGPAEDDIGKAGLLQARAGLNRDPSAARLGQELGVLLIMGPAPGAENKWTHLPHPMTTPWGARGREEGVTSTNDTEAAITSEPVGDGTGSCEPTGGSTSAVKVGIRIYSTVVIAVVVVHVIVGSYVDLGVWAVLIENDAINLLW